MPKQFNLTVVRWWDAYIESDVSNPATLAPHFEMETVGFKVKETEHAISIAHERCEKDGTFRSVTTIPMAYVKEVHEFTCKAPRPRIKKVKDIVLTTDNFTKSL